MSILFMDGFDAGEQQWVETWQIGTAYGRYGTIGVNVGDGSNRQAVLKSAIVVTDPTLAFAMGLQVVASSDGENICQHMFGSGTSFVWTTGNQIRIENVPDDNADFDGTGGNFVQDEWHWVEAEVFYHASAGTIKVWLNGVLEIDESSLTITQPGSVGLQIGGTGSGDVGIAWFDDIVFSDGAGSYNNTRPFGDMQAVPLYPSGDGATSGLTGSDDNQVDNYLLVNETGNPDTADYVGSQTEGDLDTYVLDDLADTSSTIFAIALENYVIKSDTGVKFGRGVIRTNSVDYPQTSNQMTAGWVYEVDFIEENPDTTNAWTGTEINALEAGFEVRDS